MLSLYCYFYNFNGSLLYRTRANMLERYVSECPLNYGKSLPSSVYLHQWNESRDGSIGDLEPDEAKGPNSWRLPISNNAQNNNTKKPQVALCLSAIYGDVDWLILLQFFAYYSFHVDAFFVKTYWSTLKEEIKVLANCSYFHCLEHSARQ